MNPTPSAANLDRERGRDEALGALEQIKAGDPPLEIVYSIETTRHGYSLLLAGGGPEAAIRGLIGSSGQASTAELCFRNWHVPWTPVELNRSDAACLLAFAQRTIQIVKRARPIDSLRSPQP